MNPFRKNNAAALVLYVVLALVLGTAAGVPAAVMPETKYLDRISGVIAPMRMAMDTYGKLYVADPRNGGVIQFDGAGNRLNTFQIKGARGVALTSTGDLVVTHGAAASVIDPSTKVERFTLGPFKQANGVTVDDAGAIYVVDTLASIVQVFAANGQPVAMKNSAAGNPANSFATSGSGSGQLSFPTAIAFDKVSKQLIVADTGNSRLVFFAQDGTFIRTVGTRAKNGTTPSFTAPQSVALEYSKNSPQTLQRIYVSDSFQSEVYVIDPAGQGASLGSIGGYGSTPGKLKVPVDALFDATSSRLFIANGAGDVTMYGINVTTSPVPDTTPPFLSLDATPAVTFLNTLVIGGSVEKEASVQVTGVLAGSVSYYPAPDASLVYWQAAVSGLNGGNNTITVTARDSAANATVKTATIAYDPQSISVTITSFAAPVNVGIQPLSGTVDAGATVSLSGPGGVSFDPVVMTGATTWQSKVTGLGEGINVVTATATNGAKSSAATARITLLTAQPKLDISALPDKSVTAQPLVNVSGTLPRDSYFKSLTINGIEVPVLDNAFSASVQLKSGANPITIVAEDVAGNKSVATRTITLDEGLPAVAVTEPADGSYVNGTDVNLKGAAQAGSTVKLLLYNGSANGLVFSPAISTDGSWSTSGPLPLDPGLNTIVVEVTDKAGASSRIKTTVTRDATVPAMTIANPVKDVAVHTASQTVTGTVSPGSELSATLDNVAVPVVVSADGKTYSIPVALATEKQYVLAITAADALGNSVTTSRTIVYDVTAPVTTADPVNPLKITFSDGVPEVLNRNGVPLTGFSVTVNGDGSKTADFTALAAANPQLDIHIIDAAGNSTRNGDLDGNGKVDIKDALALLRVSSGLDSATAVQKLRCDVAPVVGGKSKPDGVLDVFDIVYVLEKIVGLR